MPGRLLRTLGRAGAGHRVGVTVAMTVVALCALAGTGLADGW